MLQISHKFFSKVAEELNISLGNEREYRLYRPKDGTKEFPGVLRGYEDGRVTIDYLGKPVTFEKSEVALVRLRATF